MPTPSRSPVVPFLSALSLYGLHHVVNVLALAVVPMLLAIGRASPRFAALGWLGLVLSPVAIVVPVHRLTHAVIDHFDKGPRAPGPGAATASLWAGIFAWCAMVFSSIASALLLVAVFPPPVEDGLFAVITQVLEDARLAVGVHAVLWVAVATLLYYVERLALRASK